ncbi:uncharacterized protein LOC112558355 [Pomacea canaliculata]|uniref:uncharacterized protein LOC112558355 n=1 Tax=Pomacea canaliculata TaxID=400727 RepID=UPI000D729D86|nr:uncharacterized protein LOC112558355 [Pomacea canaliculata]
MDFVVFEVHIQHMEEKERGSVTSDTQAANRPDEAEQTCDHVVDDQMRRNISNMDINEQTSHPNISSPTATESDDMNREVESERTNSCVDSNFTTTKLGATDEDVETASIEEAAKVTETPSQVQNDDGRLEENTSVTENPALVLNDDGQLEENTIVTDTPVQVLNGNGRIEETETPARVLSGNGQLEENTSVTENPAQVLNSNGRLEGTETPVQVLNDDGRLEENTIVTETPVQVLSGNGQLEENTSVTETPAQMPHSNGRLEGTETPVQVLNDDGQLEENTNVTETRVQVLSGNGLLEETETPAQVLEDNGQLKEKTSVTETSVQVHNGNVSLKENTIVTKTPVQVLDGNGRRKENASVTEKGVEKRHNSSKTHLFPSPSGSGNSKNTEKGLKKVVKKRSPESSSSTKPEETKGRESDEDNKHLAASVLAVWSQNLPPEKEDQCIFQKPDTRSRMQKLLARRRGEKEKKPVKRATTASEPTMISQLDVRLQALDQAINRDFHDDLLMARQMTMPRLFQRSPKLQARWKVMHDVRMLQDILVSMRCARERREEEKRKEREREALQTAEGAQDEPTADDSQDKEDTQTPESSKESPENSSPDITIAVIHAEDPPTPGDEGSAHTGDEPGAGPAALDVPKEGQKTVALSTSQVKIATSRVESRSRLERSYTTVPFQLPPSTSFAGRRQPPSSQQQTTTGRLRRTITSLSMSRGRRSSATRVSPAMMCRIQDAEKIYGGQ